MSEPHSESNLKEPLYVAVRSYRNTGAHIKPFIVESGDLWQYDPTKPKGDYFWQEKKKSEIVFTAVQSLAANSNKDLLNEQLKNLSISLDQPAERTKFKRRSYGEVQGEIIELHGNPFQSDDAKPVKKVKNKKPQSTNKIKKNAKVADPTSQTNTEYEDAQNVDGFPNTQVGQEGGHKKHRNKKKMKNKAKDADPTLEEIVNYEENGQTSDGLPKKQVEGGERDEEDGVLQEYKERMEGGTAAEIATKNISSDVAENSDRSENSLTTKMVRKSKSMDDDDRVSVNGRETREIDLEVMTQTEEDIPENQLGLPNPWEDERTASHCITSSDSRLERREEDKQDRTVANKMQGLNNLEESEHTKMKEYYIKLKAYKEKSQLLLSENEGLKIENRTLTRQIERLTTCVSRLEGELNKRRNEPGEHGRVATTANQLTAASASSDSGCVVLSVDDPERLPFKLGNEPFTQAQKDRWRNQEVRRRYKKFKMDHPVTGEKIEMYHLVLNVNILYTLWRKIKHLGPETFMRKFIPAAWTLLKLCNRGYKVVSTTVRMIPNSPRKCFTPKKRCAAEIIFWDQICKKIPISEKNPKESKKDRLEIFAKFSTIMGDKVSQAQKIVKKISARFEDYMKKEIPVDLDNPDKSLKKHAEMRAKLYAFLDDPFAQDTARTMTHKDFPVLFPIDEPGTNASPEGTTAQEPREPREQDEPSTPVSRPGSRGSIRTLGSGSSHGMTAYTLQQQAGQQKGASPSLRGCTTSSARTSTFVPRHPIRCHLNQVNQSSTSKQHESATPQKSRSRSRSPLRRSPTISESSSKTAKSRAKRAAPKQKELSSPLKSRSRSCSALRRSPTGSHSSAKTTKSRSTRVSRNKNEERSSKTKRPRVLYSSDESSDESQSSKLRNDSSSEGSSEGSPCSESSEEAR